MVDHNLILNHPALSEILVTQKEIESRVAEIGDLISKDYEGREPLLVGVLKGGVIFTTDLCRAIDLPVHANLLKNPTMLQTGGRAGKTGMPFFEAGWYQ